MDEILWKLLEQTIVILINMLLPVAIAAGVAWIRKMWKEARAAEPDKMRLLEAIASQVVLAAEQLGMTGAIADKKTYAIEQAQKYLAAYGIKLDLAVIENAIEAAVFNEFNRYNWPPEEEPVE